MQERVKKFLQEIGLSEKEAIIYIALLSVDNYSVAELAKATDINRTTLYPILDDLIAKRLVVEVKENNKVRFQAEPPERIETYILNRKNQLEEQEKVLDDIIPQMRGFLRESGEKPIVKIYEGRDGVLQSLEERYETSSKDNQEYLIYPRDEIKNLFSEKEMESARKMRLKKNNFMNSIFTSTEEYSSNDNAKRLRITNSEKYPITCEIGIYADIVYLHIFSGKNFALNIKSKEFADTLKTLFKLASESSHFQKKDQPYS